MKNETRKHWKYWTRWRNNEKLEYSHNNNSDLDKEHRKSEHKKKLRNRDSSSYS